MQSLSYNFFSTWFNDFLRKNFFQFMANITWVGKIFMILETNINLIMDLFKDQKNVNLKRTENTDVI